MISNVNLEIEIVHDKPLDMDAQHIASTLAVVLYQRLSLSGSPNGLPSELPQYAYGRRSMAGAEDKNNVSIFLRSAVISGR